MNGTGPAPPTPMRREDFPSIVADLEPLVQRCKHDRIAAGFTYAESVFVAHATDNLELGAVAAGLA